jgi:hypothetical protein
MPQAAAAANGRKVAQLVSQFCGNGVDHPGTRTYITNHGKVFSDAAKQATKRSTGFSSRPAP